MVQDMVGPRCTPTYLQQLLQDFLAGHAQQVQLLVPHAVCTILQLHTVTHINQCQ